MKLLAMSLMAATVAAATTTRRATGSAGCGINHRVGYNSNSSNGFSMKSDNRDRRYTMLVPKGYDPTRPYPLILDFHGYGGSPGKQHAVSQYDKFDVDGDFLVVYPAGVDASWEGAPYAVDGVDDLLFATDLVARIQDKYCVDAARVYASGKSNGGGFVGTLACSPEGSIFAAFAMSAAAFYTDNLDANTATYRECTPSRAVVPVLEVHGSADEVIPYDGKVRSDGGVTPPVWRWLDAWGERNGVASAKKVEHPSPEFGSRVNVTTYAPDGAADDVAPVTGIWIEGMSHCWASEQENHDWESQADCQAPLNATPLFLDFFNKWDVAGRIG